MDMLLLWSIVNERAMASGAIVGNIRSLSYEPSLRDKRTVVLCLFCAVLKGVLRCVHLTRVKFMAISGSAAFADARALY